MRHSLFLAGVDLLKRLQSQKVELVVELARLKTANANLRQMACVKMGESPPPIGDLPHFPFLLLQILENLACIKTIMQNNIL